MDADVVDVTAAAPDAQAPLSPPGGAAPPGGGVAASPLCAPEAEEARPRLVKALHGTLLQTHINAPAKQQAAVDALLKLVQNVLREPGADKYRRVRCGNDAFRSRVSAVKGGEEFLRAAGWRDATIEFERHLQLDPHASLEVLRLAERLLQKVQTAVVEKAERHERDTWLAKNEGKLAREQTLAALAADKAERRERAERAAAAAAARPPAAAAAEPPQLPPPA